MRQEGSWSSPTRRSQERPYSLLTLSLVEGVSRRRRPCVSSVRIVQRTPFPLGILWCTLLCIRHLLSSSAVPYPEGNWREGQFSCTLYRLLAGEIRSEGS